MIVLSPRIAWAPVLAALLASACATTVPLQTASVVPPEQLRAGGQVSVAPWCSFGRTFDTDCAAPVWGTPWPELGASARMGVAERMDAGLFARGAVTTGPGAPSPAVNVGLLADVKRELWSKDRWLVSGAVGLGYGADAGFERFVHQGSLVLPLFAAYRAQRWELVVSPRLIAEADWWPAAVDPAARWSGQVKAGLALAAIRQGPWRWSFQLGYQTPVHRPGGGAWQLGLGLLFDAPRSVPQAGQGGQVVDQR